MADAKAYVTYTNADVLCGRGQTPFRHEGNHRLRMKIALNLDEYISLDCSGKASLIHDVIISVMRERGRFLVFDRSVGKWYDSGLEAAENQVGSAFRDASVPGKVKCVKAMKSSIQTTKTVTQCSSPMESTCSISGLDKRPVLPSSACYPLFEPLSTTRRELSQGPSCSLSD